mgnify:CR=1 FL=1
MAPFLSTMSYGGDSNLISVLVHVSPYSLTDQLALSTRAMVPFIKMVHPVINGVLSEGQFGSISDILRSSSLGFDIGEYKQSIISLDSIAFGSSTISSWFYKAASY